MSGFPPLSFRGRVLVVALVVALAFGLVAGMRLRGADSDVEAIRAAVSSASTGTTGAVTTATSAGTTDSTASSVPATTTDSAVGAAPANVVGGQAPHLATPPTPGAGWTPLGWPVAGSSAMYVTGVGGATAVWMDPRLARFQLHPGSTEPPGHWSTPSFVPTSDYPNLLAAFNGGFKMVDSHGGFLSDGAGAQSLVTGAATFAVNGDGTPTVGAWGRDITPADGIVAARQNLTLIVDGGRPAPTVSDRRGDPWGATFGGAVYVWRSGVGVTNAGAIVYVAGPSLSSRSLANALTQAGVVRGMELDINATWVTFNTYQDINGNEVGAKLVPAMTQPGGRYLSPDHRDFIAVLARQDPQPPSTPPPTASAA